MGIELAAAHSPDMFTMFWNCFLFSISLKYLWTVQFFSSDSFLIWNIWSKQDVPTILLSVTARATADSIPRDFIAVAAAGRMAPVDEEHLGQDQHQHGHQHQDHRKQGHQELHFNQILGTKLPGAWYVVCWIGITLQRQFEDLWTVGQEPSEQYSFSVNCNISSINKMKMSNKWIFSIIQFCAFYHNAVLR